jgi:hypothetical protein
MTEDPGDPAPMGKCGLASHIASLDRRRRCCSGRGWEHRLGRPDLTLDTATLFVASTSPDFRQRFIDGLRLAGLGEE